MKAGAYSPLLSSKRELHKALVAFLLSAHLDNISLFSQPDINICEKLLIGRHYLDHSMMSYTI